MDRYMIYKYTEIHQCEEICMYLYGFQEVGWVNKRNRLIELSPSNCYRVVNHSIQIY